MISFRGDAWKFYLKLKRTQCSGEHIEQLKEITEIEEIQKFYEALGDRLLMKIRYRMVKEKKGSGMVPILVSTIPWLLFIFSKQLQGVLFRDGSYLWALFAFFYLAILISSVIVHFRENAWANVHTEIIDDILSERRERRGENTKEGGT